GGVADANGNVDSHQRDVRDSGRMESAREDVKPFDLGDARGVPNGSVHDQAGAGFRHDGRSEIIADDGSSVDFSEEIDHHHVALHKRIDDPGVLATADAALLLPMIVDHGVHVRPGGHEHASDGAAHQALAAVQFLPISFKLEPVTGTAQSAPRLLGGYIAESVE